MSMTINKKKYPTWVKDLISDLAYTKLTAFDLADKYNKSSSRIYHYKEDPNIIQEVERLKAELIDEYKQKASILIESAFKAYEDLIKSADTDATRLKAAEQILKNFGIISEKQQIEHSGEIKLPPTIFTNNPNDINKE